jgi:hypothetical protein
MIFHRRKEEKKSYDSARQMPCIRVSICTGEETAGFKDRETGRFTEVMMIRSADDLEEFRQEYGIQEEIKRFY